MNDQVSRPSLDEVKCLASELRELSGEPMMECKKALHSCNFDLVEAHEHLKQRKSSGHRDYCKLVTTSLGRYI